MGYQFVWEFSQPTELQEEIVRLVRPANAQPCATLRLPIALPRSPAVGELKHEEAQKLVELQCSAAHQPSAHYGAPATAKIA